MNNDILKALDDLFVIVLMLENLKKKVDKSLLFYLYQVEASALASFNYYFDKFCKERGLIYVK